MDIILKNVGHLYRDVPILEDITINFQDRGVYTLLGASGCGKSTLLNIIAGQEVFQKGTISYNNQTDITFPIGYMSQNDLLLPFYSVYKNLLLVCSLQKQDLKEAGERIECYIRTWGLEKYLSYYPHQLSQGLKQRISLIRQCLIKTPLILLDEPFCALDVVSKRNVQKFLLQHIRESKKTAILVTHDIKEACFFSDSIFILGGGPTSVKKRVDISGSSDRETQESLIIEALIEYHPSFSAYGDVSQ